MTSLTTFSLALRAIPESVDRSPDHDVLIGEKFRNGGGYAFRGKRYQNG